MIQLKIRKIGNSLGVVLPREALAKLQAGEGDAVFLAEVLGGYMLSGADPEFVAQMTEAEAIMKRRRSALKALAK